MPTVIRRNFFPTLAEARGRQKITVVIPVSRDIQTWLTWGIWQEEQIIFCLKPLPILFHQ